MAGIKFTNGAEEFPLLFIQDEGGKIDEELISKWLFGFSFYGIPGSEYDHVHYLSNINLKPTAETTNLHEILPIFHAAVIFTRQNQPVVIIAVESTELLTRLRRNYGPTKVEMLFKCQDGSEENVLLSECWGKNVAVNIMDIRERPMTNDHNDPKQRVVTRIISLPGWLSAEQRDSFYQAIGKLDDNIKKEFVDKVTYRLEVSGFDIAIEHCYTIFWPDGDDTVGVRLIQTDKIAGQV